MMSHSKTSEWIRPVLADDQAMKGLAGMHSVIARILHGRGVRNRGDAESFLKPSLESLPDPFALFDMDRAVRKVEAVIKAGGSIYIHGDFDADGLAATAIVWEYLYRERGANVRPYIPSRVDEGYGMSEKSISAIIGKGADLVISVDCGIRDADIIRKFRRRTGSKKGVDFVITDHHQLSDKLPAYVPVVHPMHPKGSYPDAHISGSAVAWKLVAAMEKQRNASEVSWEKIRGIDLVAFSTITDIVPLQGENRVLAAFGIKSINDNPRPGIKAMIDESGLGSERISAYHIGHVLGPRINAAGRIGDPVEALRLLTTGKERFAKTIAAKLGNLNRRRQEQTEELFEIVRTEIENEGTGSHLYFASGNDWPEGIIGIVAGRLQELYHRPVVLVSRGKQSSRGSGRSIDGFDIVRALGQFGDLLESHGGHPLAAGFTVHSDHIERLKSGLQAYADGHISTSDLEVRRTADVVVDISDLDWELAEELVKLEPFGFGNRQPVFWVSNAVVVDTSRVGDGSHIRLRVRGSSSETLDGIFFRGASSLRESGVSTGSVVDILGYLEIHEWNGRRSLQLRVIDIRLSG